MAVASGMHDVVLVGGTERMTSCPPRVRHLGARDSLCEIPAGFTFRAMLPSRSVHASYGMKPST
jgi:acetyl-CoA acetyltransferase